MKIIAFRICNWVAVCMFFSSVHAQNHQDFISYIEGKNVFHVSKPDYKKSPYTGMTRKHWKDAALYLLQGAFGYIHHIDDPMKFPKQPGKSYPRTALQIPTEKLEGLCRTLFVAARLLKEDSSLTINHIRVADYYRHQIAKLLDPGDSSYIKPRLANGGPSQVLVEFGALSLSLFNIPEILWQPLPQKQKDALAATMLSYGDGPTVPSNWKFFNIFVLSFFKSQGYTVNEPLLKEYLDKSLAHYRGDGWYNDNPAYDYYSMWAFQMYGMVWSEVFGKKYYPDYAEKFLHNFIDIKNRYPDMFGRNGEMIMWGRSISYRIGSVAPLALTAYENSKQTNYGWMRRMASGVLLQFLKNPDFLQDNVPTLGFYGPFEPAVQSYSCRGSVYWMGKAFFALYVPAGHSFWQATENEGKWENGYKKNKVYNHYADTAQILITDYPNIGAAEIRAWCYFPVVHAGEPFRGSENYNRLSYNSAFPWQADSSNGAVAMNYVFKTKADLWEPLHLFTIKKFEDGIYYREAVLETDSAVHMYLADMPLPNGILRIDKTECSKSIPMRLGHYALPEINAIIKHKTIQIGNEKMQAIDNGKYQLAMIPLQGWSHTEIMHCVGLHPAARKSAVINLSEDASLGSSWHITLMLWKKSGERWSSQDVSVKSVQVTGSNALVKFYDGSQQWVRF